jgi:hypothetical protein
LSRDSWDTRTLSERNLTTELSGFPGHFAAIFILTRVGRSSPNFARICRSAA